jgi:circadian clock protein KaiC
LITLAEKTLIKTGIAGLDEVLLGGIPHGNLIVVQGTSGSGKTLLGMEFIYQGIIQFNEPGIIVVFETSPGKIIRDAAALGWNFEELQEQKKLQIVFTTPEVLNQELRAPDSLLLETAVEMGARRIFIDGINLIHRVLLASRAAGVPGADSYRELLQQLVEALARENLTAMFSLETGHAPQSLMNEEDTNYLADTVIQLTRTEAKRRMFRNLQIIKSRGHDFETGQHTLQITDGQGLEVFRRVQAPRRSNIAQPTSSAKRSVTGVEALDTLIGGGIFDGSTTLVLGVSGVGKTVLGTHLLREGVVKQSARGLLISLDEHPAQIVRNAATIGLNLQELIDDGTLHIMFESPQELNLDRHFAQITRMVEKHNIQRMVIDGLTSYSSAVSDQTNYREFFHALVSFSKGRLMTTFLNYENPEFLGLSTFMPDFPVSSIVDNIILLSLVEVENSLRRCITVVKARGSQHEFDSREYRIGIGGINLQPTEVSVPMHLPFSAYTSILSRAPTRFPAEVADPTLNKKLKPS